MAEIPDDDSTLEIRIAAVLNGGVSLAIWVSGVCVELHHLVLTAAGTYPGLLVVRYDNDPTRDMKPKDIVSAIRKLEQSGLDTTNQLITLNRWR